MTWEHFRHEADIGVRGHDTTLEGAYAETARALTAVVTDPDTVTPRQPVHIHCANEDQALLLADWLNALIYEMATRRMLFSKFDITLKGTHLKATAWGEEVNVSKHQPATEVKGATYTELKVEHHPDGHWTAQCVVDV